MAKTNDSKTKSKKNTKSKAKKKSQGKTAVGLKLRSKTKANKKVIAWASLVLAAVIAVTGIGIGTHLHKSSKKFFEGESVVDGIDVSQHNGEIDWKDVSKATDFAIIRVGYRGYSSGEIVEDELARYNLKHANRAGIPVGVYFYTQAITEEEAIEEAKLALKVVRWYDVDLPIFIDFEYASEDGESVGRLYESDMTAKDRAKIINAFCETVTDAGYTAGLYASSGMLNYSISTSKLSSDIVIWVADYNDSVTYIGDFDIWQYSNKGSCDGVNSTYVDMNKWYLED